MKNLLFLNAYFIDNVPMDEIIIIDDEQDLLELSVDAFTLEDLNARGFSDPLLALEYLKTNKVLAIVSDANMPGMSGHALFLQLKKIRGEEGIEHFFLCTGQIDLNEDELIREGITKIINKPYDILEMIGELKKILGKS